MRARKASNLPDEYVLNGLRKGPATLFVEADVGDFMQLSVMGPTNSSQAKVYTEKAKRKEMTKKAMDMLEDGKRTSPKSCGQ